MIQTLKIGDLARQANCRVESIRYYERERLLPRAPRSGGNYRLYNKAHVQRLRFIRHCRSLDMTLDEIRRLLTFRDAPDGNCGEVNLLLDEHIGHVASRIAELKRLEKELRKLRGLCGTAQATRNCGILQRLSTPSADNLRDQPQILGTHERRTSDLHSRRARPRGASRRNV